MQVVVRVVHCFAERVIDGLRHPAVIMTGVIDVLDIEPAAGAFATAPKSSAFSYVHGGSSPRTARLPVGYRAGTLRRPLPQYHQSVSIGAVSMPGREVRS